MKRLITFLILGIPVFLCAAKRSVPADHPTIASAIAASSQGDTVVVFPGTYFENINFKGKNIVVTSRFWESGDTKYIANTVINGGSPAHPDTASCVLIVSGENASAVLQGFTLTGGKGTRWVDEHGAGIYREGGAVLVTFSSPTIRYNYIINNEVVNGDNVVSTGGGGIRIGDGGGIVENNIITLNKAMYGGGIVLNYCSGTIVRNNLILENSVRSYVAGKPSFGGGGLWLGNPKPGDNSPNIIENNTIYGNTALDNPFSSFAAGRGGAMVIHSNIGAVIRNNIIWENHSSYPISAVAALSPAAVVEYNDILGGYPGKGNIDVDPQFADTSFLLLPGSPCVDAGDTASIFNDPNNGASALLPAMGTKRNDMGAYGGTRSRHFTPFARPSLFLPLDDIDLGNRLQGDSVSLSMPFVNFGSKTVTIDSLSITSGDFSIGLTTPAMLPVNVLAMHQLIWKPAQQKHYADTMLVFHNSTYKPNPAVVLLRGNTVPTPVMSVVLTEHNFGSFDINTPSKDTTIYIYNRGTGKDSIRLGLNTTGLNPSDAVKLSVTAFALQPGDSQSVTFTFYPKQIKKSITGAYAPRILFKSLYGADTATVEKLMRFRITGTLGLDDQQSAPSEFSLKQNYPNPFNPATTIMFSFSGNSASQGKGSGERGTLKIFDLLGKEVAVLFDGVAEPGKYHRVIFDASHLASGLYFARLSSGGNTQMKRMQLIK